MNHAEGPGRIKDVELSVEPSGDGVVLTGRVGDDTFWGTEVALLFHGPGLREVAASVSWFTHNRSEVSGPLDGVRGRVEACVHAGSSLVADWGHNDRGLVAFDVRFELVGHTRMSGYGVMGGEDMLPIRGRLEVLRLLVEDEERDPWPRAQEP